METQAQYPPVKVHDNRIWRDRIAFWIIGLQIRFGYVLMIVAAKDILRAPLPKGVFTKKTRHHHELTTGVVLMLGSASALLSHWILPCLPAKPNLFITISMLASIAGYFILAFGIAVYVKLVSVIFISLGYGIGEYKLIKLRSAYPYKDTRFYESGYIHAEFIAVFFYTGLRLLKINMTYIILSFLSVPVLGLACFWLLLRSPKVGKTQHEVNALTFFNLEPKSMSCDEKMRYTCYLIKYVMSFGVMSFLRGYVNQGLYEFIYFHKNFVDIDLQYCIFIFFFNLGFYACLVTRNLLLVRHVILCVIFQLLIAVTFTLDVIFGFIPYLWTIWLLAYIQGITHGVAYTSSMDKMLENEASEFLDVAKAIAKSTILISAILSGAFDFGVYYFLSKSPEPSRP